jgi:PAS domain S-box-containing protein
MVNQVRHQLTRRSRTNQTFSEATLLYGVVCVVLGGTVVFTLLTMILVAVHPLWYVLSGSLITALSLMMYCIRAGWNTLAKYGTCLSLWLFSTVATIFDGGLQSPLLFCYSLVLACSHFLCTKSAKKMLFGLVIASILSLALAEQAAWLPPSSLIGSTTLGVLVTFLCVFGVLAALMQYAHHGLHRTLQQLQQSEAERKKLEAALRASELRFRRVSELSSDFCFGHTTLSDGTSRLEWGTEAIARISGYTHDELRNSANWEAITHPDDLHLLAQHRQNVRAGNSDRGEFRILSKDGRVHWLRITGHPEFDEQQQHLTGIYGVIQDITVVKRLEQQLSQAQKLESVGRLAGGVAHDFNNMLTVILGNCSLMLDTIEEDHPLYSDIEHIRFAAERASGLSKQLLAFSRRQVLQTMLVNVNESIQSTTRLLARLLGKGHQLATNLSNETIFVKIDPGQLDQVLMNLTVNARDAMSEQGTLTISTRTVQVHHHDVEQYELTPGKYAVISVQDTGCGMDAATQAKAFEPFFTTKAMGIGTGLGLATIQSIVRQYQGAIKLTSELNKGTQIDIYLPASEVRP